MKIEQKLPSKEALVSLIKRTKVDLDFLMKKIIREFLKKAENLDQIHEVFAYVYEHLYHEILFEKLPLDRKVAKLIELLAMPMDHKSFPEQKEVLRSVFRRSKFVRSVKREKKI